MGSGASSSSSLELNASKLSTRSTDSQSSLMMAPVDLTLTNQGQLKETRARLIAGVVEKARYSGLSASFPVFSVGPPVADLPGSHCRRPVGCGCTGLALPTATTSS
ncbi:hypothetical protein MRX96_053578 [Rhipicephalus microplus]